MTAGRDLAALPKAHLHLHLDGAMRPATLTELAREAGVAMPAIGRYRSFTQFMAVLVAVQRVLTTRAHLERLVCEVVEDAAADGAVWLEVSMWPGMVSATLGSWEESTRIVLAAGRQAAARLGVGFGLMLAANRERGPDEAVAVARLAASLRDQGVVSFGMDGDEMAFAMESFAPAFAIAKDAGLLATPHAGELGGLDNVRAALDSLHADRILHGVRAVEDDDLVRRLADAGIALDVCPTSNVILSVVPDLASHPLPALLRAGVRCSVNADDPLPFGTSLLAEYQLCRQTLGLSDAELASIARTSLESSAAPVALISRALMRIDTWLSGSM